MMDSSMHFSDKPHHVLITGATGFIGTLLVNALLQDGHRVTVLTRHVEKAARHFKNAVRCVRSLDMLDDAEPVDVVINLAGARILGPRWTPTRKQALRQSRIGTTQGLVRWIARSPHKPALLLSASAIGYYGIQARDDNTLLQEDSPPQAIFMSTLCQEWEAAAHEASLHGVRVVCMRFGLVLGKQGALPPMMMPVKLGLGGRLGDGRQSLSWIHVQDLLRAIAHVWRAHETAKNTGMQQDAIAAYNFTAPHCVSQAAFIKTAADILHRPCIVPTPAWPVRLLLGEQADLLLEGQKVAPARLQAEQFSFSYPDVQSALRNLLE